MQKLFFDLRPLVIPAGRVAAVRVRPRFEHVSWQRLGLRRIGYVRGDGRLTDGRQAEWQEFQDIPYSIAPDGVLTIEMRFDDEEEHHFRFFGAAPDCPAIRLNLTCSDCTPTRATSICTVSVPTAANRRNTSPPAAAAPASISWPRPTTGGTNHR